MARDDDDLLEELKDRYLDATAEWDAIRDEGAKDMRAIAGDPWDPADRRARDDAGRPCLALDELGQYVNQVINDLRANKRGIVVSPKGGGANDLTAAFRQGKIRDIEYQSHAVEAYTTMAENAIQRGYGFLRITARYSQPDAGFDQELAIEPVVNPDLVTPDPDHVRTDGSDLSFLFYETRRTIREFAREFPEATVKSFSADTMQASRGWVTGDQVRLAEYWVKEPGAPRTLLLLKPPPTMPGAAPIEVYADALPERPPADQILKSRLVTPTTVKQYLTNGVEILASTTWLGPSIPWVCCYGKVLYLQDGAGRAQRQLLSLIRLARDPYMLYCYYRTCQAELVGMTPKFPYFVAQGQLDAANLLLLQQSLAQPVAVVEFQTKTMAQPEGGLGPPMRQPYEPPIQALELGAEGARRAIQAAIGASPLPTAAQRHNEKSGVALKQIEDTAQRGTYHFTDHHDDAVRRCGEILDECIPRYYDTARDTAIRDPKDQPQIVRINDPAARGVDGGPAPVDTQQGEHQVTISVGPKKDSERDAASDFADSVISNPQLAQVIGPQKMADLIASSIRLKNLGPIGDEMAETIAPTDKQKVDPRAVQQQMQAMQQELQKLQAVAQQQHQALESKQQELAAKHQTEVTTANIAADKDLAIAAMNNARAIAVAHIGAATKGLSLQAHADEEAQALGHEAALTFHDAQHERRMQADAHAQDMMAAAQDYQAQARLAAQAQPAGPPMGPPVALGAAAEPAPTGAGA